MNLATTALPVALAIIMLGLGLSLTIGDFTRVLRAPRVLVIALVIQLLILPSVCFGLVELFNLPPVLAVGLLLLAASPGGPGANLYSHLFGGDVALNVSLTAINSVISAVSLPLIYNLAATHFTPNDSSLGLQFGKAAEVFAIVLIPVAAGMFVRRIRIGIAVRMERPVRIGSIVVLAVLVVGTIFQNRDVIGQNIGELAAVTGLFGLISMTLGFALPRALRVDHRKAVACSFEIGLHNGVVAIVIAQTVIGSVEMSVPAAVSSIIMLPAAVIFGFWLRSRNRTQIRRAVEISETA
jgi:BASS family bile acid:Na+ symporter